MVNFSCLISDSSIRLIQSFERRQIRTELRQLTTVFEKILILSSYPIPVTRSRDENQR